MITNLYNAADPLAIADLVRADPAAGVAGYIDGDTKWPAHAWTMFAGHPLKRISVQANPLADIFDLEATNAPAAQVLDAVIRRAAVYLPSVVYVDADDWELAERYFADAPVAWWVAEWVVVPPVPYAPPPGQAAWQWESLPYYETSVVNTDIWPQW